MERRKGSRDSAGRRRRARNPRTGARAEPEQGPGFELAPDEEVLAVSADTLANMRVMIESTGTEAAVDAAMKGFLLRIVAQLEAVCERAADGESEFRLFTYAWLALAPALALDWLHAGQSSFHPGLSRQELDHVERLRRERAARQAGPSGASPEGRWGAMIELIAEAVEVFGGFRFWEGVRGCLELHQELEAQLAAVE